MNQEILNAYFQSLIKQPEEDPVQKLERLVQYKPYEEESLLTEKIYYSQILKNNNNNNNIFDLNMSPINTSLLMPQINMITNQIETPEIHHPIPLNPRLMKNFILEKSLIDINSNDNDSLLLEQLQKYKLIEQQQLIAKNQNNNSTNLIPNQLISVFSQKNQNNNNNLSTNQLKRPLNLEMNSTNQIKKLRLSLDSNVSSNESLTPSSSSLSSTNWLNNNDTEDDENIDVETIDDEDLIILAEIKSIEKKPLLNKEISKEKLPNCSINLEIPSCSETNKIAENSTTKRLSSTTPETDSSSLKLHRKAHIEFYRKVKSLKNRGQSLECQLCLEEVVNNETSVRSHVHQRHQDQELFVCRTCSKGFKDQIEIFDHIKQVHPGTNQQNFEDRRNMSDLILILQDCFPRGCLKNQTEYRKMFESLMQLTTQKTPLTEFICQECQQVIEAEKSAILKHLSIHSVYKCKLCKFLSTNESEQIEHSNIVHAKKLAKQKAEKCEAEVKKDNQKSESNENKECNKKNFQVCKSMEVLKIVLRKCLFDFYCYKKDSQNKKQKKINK